MKKKKKTLPKRWRRRETLTSGFGDSSNQNGRQRHDDTANSRHIRQDLRSAGRLAWQHSLKVSLYCCLIPPIIRWKHEKCKRCPREGTNPNEYTLLHQPFSLICLVTMTRFIEKNGMFLFFGTSPAKGCHQRWEACRNQSTGRNIAAPGYRPSRPLTVKSN